MNLSSKILIGVIIMALLASFLFGNKYGYSRKICPPVSSNTVYVHDTAWITIHDTTTYPLKPDTITVVDSFPQVVDTVAILHKFFNKYTYIWQQSDSSIIIDGTTVVSQNNILKNDVKYKWLKPTTIVNTTVDNSVYYNRNITLGISVPVNSPEYITLDAMYNWSKGGLGVGYSAKLKSFEIKASTVLIKFKERK